nr:kelch repeat-containing protein [uncultured Aminipila sp.]
MCVKTKTWTEGEKRTSKRIYSSVCAVGKKIYVIGGKSGSDLQNKVEIYDIATDTWSVGTSMPTKRCSMADSVIANKIYIMGGTDNAGPKGEVEIYDATTDTWSTGSPMLTKVNGPRGTFIAGKIYVAGGVVDNSTLKQTDAVQIYDIKTNSWKLGISLPTLKGGFGYIAIGNNMYEIGGASFNPYTTYSTVDIYDTVSKTWSKGTQLPSPRVSARAVLIDGTLYLVGGHVEYPATHYISTILSLQVVQNNNLSVLLNTEETVQLSTSCDLDNNKNFTWSSTNEAVATVDTNGKVTAIAEGTADIYAQNADGTFKEYIPVKVVKGIADELRLAVHLKTGEKAKLYLTDDPSKVTWTSMDESIATVAADGQVTGVKKGLAIVKAELDGQAYQIYVRVNG